ncbi:MAG: helix-turn-helix transcriptional regulator [Kiloniellales bacterium]|nr:helix-turn-helix transcriptional regulator [Kiloniellales bacterium]
MVEIQKDPHAGIVPERGLTADPQLTSREVECLTWAAHGKSCWEVAQILSISQNTVTFHLKNAIRKLGAANKCHAAALAVAQGLIEI